MNFEDTIHASMRDYPTLNLKDELCEYRVMDQLFFVIGNGFKWENGELVDSYPENRIKLTWQQCLKEIIGRLERQEELREMLVAAGATPLIKDYSKFIFYPVSKKYSAAFNIPKDIKPDWLEAIIHYLEFADSKPLEWFTHEPDEIEQAKESKKLIKEQLERLKCQ